MRGRRPSPLDDSGRKIDRHEASKAPKAGSASSAATVGHMKHSGSPEERLAGRGCAIFAARRLAGVAELVDAHGSGPCLGNQVEVRVLSSAL